MLPLSVILQAVLPVYLVIAGGLVLRRVGTITTEMEAGLLKLVIHFLMPALILDKTLGNPLVRQPAVIAWGIGLGFGLIITGFIVSHLIGGVLKLEKGNGRRTFTLAAGVQNYGYVAIPILLALFPAGDQAVGLLFIHSLGVEVAIWVVGLMIISGNLLKNPRAFINGPIVAVILGILFSYTGIWKFFEADGSFFAGRVIREVISWLGGCAFPIGLLLIGASMSDLLSSSRPSPKIALGASFVRLLAMPIIILCAARYLPLVTELKQVLIVQAAMPAAVVPIIIARHYGGKAEIAVQVFLVTGLAALATIPLWIAWGMKFVFG